MGGPGCASSVPPDALTSEDRTLELCPNGPREVVTLEYLGGSGLLLRRGSDALLTAPFYSNPGLVRVGLGTSITPDEDRILANLPDVSDVRALLVGHAHYDHLMDVPVIVRRAPDAVVYGSLTTSRLLAPFLPKRRRVALNARAASGETPGEWIYLPGTRIRFMALLSEHSPQFLGLKFFSGEVSQDRTKPPRSAYGWKEGQTLAYLIDLLRDDGSVQLRIHYQDAASAPRLGFPPEVLLREAAVDVAVVCVGAFDQVDDYPTAILTALAPKHVLLTHWEDFFRSRDEDPELVRTDDLNELLERMAAVPVSREDWTLPRPGVALRIEVCR